MDSPQSVVSPLKNSGSAAAAIAAKKPEFSKQSKPNGNHHENTAKESTNKAFIGVLNVYIHAARDIHNICIYHKQDVYAKLCISSDPESSVNSTIINGGGQNPVFNDQVQLNVTTIEASLRCEIWMMSRVRNYLEDQLLGFALVPLSEVLISNGKLEKEFTLSSTDLFHSPAGFVRLSLDYTGAKPAVVIAPGNAGDSEILEASQIASELDKIEFPDLKIVNEDELMVSEYFGMPCTSLESDAAVVAAEAEDSESAETVQAASKADSPLSSTSVTAASNGVSSPSDSSEVAAKEKSVDDAAGAAEGGVGKDSESESSGGASSDFRRPPPMVSVNFEPEQKVEVVQQDIVNMYMKSMQQFTESLAKMKLPLDIDTGAAPTTLSPTTNSAENSSSDSKSQSGKNNRVFYGSRAFF